jgi:tyrosyl-tRNA synthetase
MYGKVMSLPDVLMESYYQLLTDVPMDDARAKIANSPNEAKMELARRIVEWMHGPDAARHAQEDWDRRKLPGGEPVDMPEIQAGGPHRIAHLIVKAGLAASNSEAIRKVKEGAVSLDGEKVTEFQRDYVIDKPTVLKLGRKYVRLVP